MAGLPHRPAHPPLPPPPDSDSGIDLPIRTRPPSSSMSTLEPNTSTERDYYDPFPSMAHDPAGSARTHVAWIQDNIISNPKYARAKNGIFKAQKISEPQLPKLSNDKPLQKTIVRLIEADTFSAAQELYRQHGQDKIAVLNMANSHFPGGGFLNGAKAQEEDLCHCSTLYKTLYRKFYPLQDNELIYSNDVLVIKQKDPPVLGGRLLPEQDWFYVDVISCAAIHGPELTPVNDTNNDGVSVQRDGYRQDTQRQLMRDKITNIMNAAVQNGVQRLVLGAFGCGVFRNPVWEVARMMKHTLIDSGDGNGPQTDWARYGLLEVVIAIYDPANRQPVWNGFMNEFRHGDGLHLPADSVPVPGHIQYTSFPPHYAGPAE